MIAHFKKLFGLDSPRISRADSLRGVPHLFDHVRQETNDGGERVLVVARRGAKFLGRFPLPPVRLILDELGATVVDLIDSRRTVAELARGFARKTGVQPREAEAGVVAFLNMLMTRGVIAISLPDKCAPGR